MSAPEQIKAYSGQGILTFGEGDQIHCAFECVQLADARIVCHCLVEGLENEHFNRAMRAAREFSDAEQLEGQTDAGVNLKVYNLRQGRTPIDPQWTTEESYVLLAFLAREMRVQVPGKSLGQGLMSFGLTNFEFLGTGPYTEHRSNGTKVGRLQLPLTLAGRQVIIRPLDDYRARMNAIKATRGVDVTATAIVDVDSPDVQTEIVALMDDLCLLLSLARGCHVQWIYRDFLSSDGEIVKTYHRDAVTKPYSPLLLIAAVPPEDTKSFVEQTFGQFRQQKERWELREAIAAYVDARLEQDYLEFRGLKLAVLMEFLKARYLALSDKTFILNEGLFREKRKQEALREGVLDVLRAVFDTASDDELDLMVKHAQGLNWYPFRQALREMFSELRLRVSSNELHHFKENRDNLVHRGRFRSAGSWQEYTSMMTLVDKILLAVVGYDGYYYDWTKPPGWVGRDMEMRVRLELIPENGDSL